MLPYGTLLAYIYLNFNFNQTKGKKKMQKSLFTPAPGSDYPAAQSMPGLTARESNVVRDAVAILQRELRRPRTGTFVRCPADVSDYLLLKYGNRDNRKREFFGLLFFSAKNELIGETIMSEGSIAACSVHPRRVAELAILQHKAAAMVLFHIHPSGCWRTKASHSSAPVFPSIMVDFS